MKTWRQCEQLVDMGLVRYIGMSNMTVPKLKEVLPLCRIQPAALEMECHPSFQQQELYDYAISHQIQPVGYCPISSPSRPERDRTAEDVADTQLPEIMDIAKVHKVADKNCRLIKGQVFLWEGARGWEDLWDVAGVITQ